MALSVKPLVYNAFQVNTYVVSHPDGDCMIIDPACYSTHEQQNLAHFIEHNNLTVKYVINTHSHVDHVLGNGFIYSKYGVKPLIHSSGLLFYDSIIDHANTFGFEVDDLVHPEEFLEDNQKIMLGDTPLMIAYTPGHADGSICLINETDRWIIAGDLLFYMSIGRTDLPTGNLEKLLSSVRNRIFVYDDDFVIYPGHGGSTTVGFERRNNPYL